MIKLFLVDVDGCLTDGCYYTGVDNSEIVVLKRFYSRDFHGLSLLKDMGIIIVFLTSSSDSVIYKRIKSSGLNHENVHCCTGVKNKASFVEKEFVSVKKAKEQFDWSEMCYIGDDLLIDGELLAKVGLPACPADADPFLIEMIRSLPSGIVLSADGGHGCIRELVHIIMNLNKTQNV